MPDDLIVDSCAPPGVRNYPRSLSHPALARRVALALALGAVGAGLLVLYVCQSRTAPFNSDGAANVLQAQSMIDGNPLLRGWWTSDVSFYSTELPEYALVEAIRGVSPDRTGCVSPDRAGACRPGRAEGTNPHPTLRLNRADTARL